MSIVKLLFLVIVFFYDFRLWFFFCGGKLFNNVLYGSQRYLSHIKYVTCRKPSCCGCVVCMHATCNIEYIVPHVRLSNKLTIHHCYIISGGTVIVNVERTFTGRVRGARTLFRMQAVVCVCRYGSVRERSLTPSSKYARRNVQTAAQLPRVMFIIRQ